MTKQATKSPVASILRPLRGALSRLLLVVGTVWLAAEPAVGQGSESSRPSDLTFDRCSTITDDAARLRCFEDAISHSDVGGSGQRSALPGAWRLVRTSNPSGGRDAVSIMHTADIARSDVAFAGLMLRCSDNDIEVLMVLLQPLPPSAHPQVMVKANTGAVKFVANVVPPGALLLLPREATALAEGAWQSAQELTVTIENNVDRSQGVVSLTGLDQALPTLLANCPSH